MLHKIANSPIYRYNKISSTMDEAHRLLEESPPHGTTITANVQSEGRGQYGKKWQSDPDKGLLMTVILEEELLDLQGKFPLARYSLSTALAICHVFQKYSWPLLDISIKWPNDVLIRDKKVAGILLETSTPWVLVGIGLNLAPQSAVPASSSIPVFPMTSLQRETGKEVDYDGLLHNIRIQLDEVYNNHQWCQEVSDLLWGRDKEVVVYFSQTSRITGILQGIDREGALMLRTEENVVRKLYTGTLRLAED